MALPNSAHVERANMNLAEVADALSQHFGRTVRLRLVAETNSSPTHRGGSPSSGDATRESRAEGPSSAAPSSGRRGARRPSPVPPSGASAAASPVGEASASSASKGRDHRVGTNQSSGPEQGADDEVFDADELDPLGEQAPGDALSWAHERVMEVFPGAEELLDE
jgi:hypothetical protein